jgi:hypothetical protein
VENLAAAIAKKTGIDDEAIQSGENLLLTFTNIQNRVGEGNDIFNQATQTITDMSVALGQDFKSSAIQVGKALQDPILGMTALRRVGVSFTEKQTEMVGKWVEQGQVLRAQKFILGELTREFGGSAEAQATASGKMSVALGNLGEQVGKFVAPAFTFLAEKLTVVANFLRQNVGPAFREAKQFVMDLWATLQEGSSALGPIIEWFQKIWDIVRPVAISMGKDLVEAATQVWHVLQSNLGPMFAALWTLLKKLWDVFKPLIIVIGVQLYIAFKVITEVLPIVIFLITKLIEWLAKIITAALSVVTFVRDKFVEPIVNFLARIVEFIKDRFVEAWLVIKGPVLAVVNAIIGVVKTLIETILKAYNVLKDFLTLSGEAKPAGSFEGQVPSRFGTPPSGQHGGEVLRTGLARIHKGEVLSGINNEMGMGGITININGDVTGLEVVRKVRDGLLKLKARNSTTGL